jgi:hypothetical protein
VSQQGELSEVANIADVAVLHCAPDNTTDGEAGFDAAFSKMLDVAI